MRRSTLVWTWIGVVAALGVAVVVTVAAVDHVRKTRQFEQASESLWYCMHRGQQCGTNPQEIEDAWLARERVYKGLVVSFVVISSGIVVVRRLRR